MQARLKQHRYLVMGRAGLDLYAHPPGTVLERATMFTSALGGSAANIAVALVRQDAEAAMLTVVSADAVGRFVIHALQGYGVDAQHVRAEGGEARNSLAVVETRAENCQSVIYRNDAADFHITSDDVEIVDFSAYSALIITGTGLAQEPSRSATLHALQTARAAGLVLIMDVDYRPYSWASAAEAQAVCLDAATLCDMVVANDDEFRVLAGGGDGLALARNLAADGKRAVMYKMGQRGCIALLGGEDIPVPVYPVKALKPTGAGDAFMGGLLAGLAAGAPWQEAVQRGAATAALVVTRVGCAPAMPDTAEVAAFMRSREV
jgi:5-dehydro-2-deoxygluconokinase